MNKLIKGVVLAMTVSSISLSIALTAGDNIYTSQFANPVFPDVEQSTRALVKNKRLFKWYKDRQLTITFDNKGTTSFDLFINGHKIEVKDLIKESFFYVPVNDFLRDGNDNTISIQNILPAGSSLIVNLPYPTLEKGNPEDVGFSSDKLKKLDELIENDIKNGFPGASIVVIKNGKIVKASSYGYARKYQDSNTLMKDPEKATPMTMYDMASNTKMFSTNFAIMHLVSEGKINIDDPIHKYIPLYTRKDKNGQSRDDRTVKDILTHSAGYTPDPQFFNPSTISAIGPDLYSQNKALTEKIICERLPFAGPKGGLPNYSDVDYMLLGMVIEHVTKMPLDKYVESCIYHPLGLKHTMYNPLQKGFNQSDCAATELDGNSRSGTVIFPNERITVLQGQPHDEKAFYCMGGVSGHAGLFSNINDMAVLAQVMLNQGGYGNVKLWNQDVESQFVKPSDLDITFGLGWRRQGDEELTWHFGPYASEYAVGHTGWTGTVTVIDPKYDMAIVLLTNAKHSTIPDPKNEPNTFAGNNFETGKYGSVMTLVYEALLEK